jgi:uncharacterized membrane protein
MEGEQVQKPTKSSGLQANIAGALAYFLGPITGILFLLIEKQNKFVRFHAMQSLIAFGLLGLLAVTPVIGWLLWGLMIIPFVWIVLAAVMMYKAFNNEEYELPVVGDIARKQIEKIK